jgi:predicted RNA-binding protein with PUA-like domain
VRSNGPPSAIKQPSGRLVCPARIATLPLRNLQARTTALTRNAKHPPPNRPSSGHWLLKSEPDVFSWEDLVARGKKGEPWTGVRNYQARNNMRAMTVGDLGFFYHSNTGKEIVGILEVIADVHPDPTDDTGKWECVDVRAVAAMPKPVSIDDAKANPELARMVLVNNTRLSVQPVTAEEWAEVSRMGGMATKKGGR